MRKHAAFLFPLLILSVTPARAADKQHLQMMAEIRLLQEQQQQLQQFLAGLQDTLKAVNTKLDEQAAATRKAMADQTLAVNNMGDNVRVLREKTDETNVRISSVSQEIEALRQALAQSQPSSAPPQPGPQPPPGPGPGPQPPPATSGGAPIGPSPQRMFETSYDDYTAGRFDLAIKGFQQFIQVYPKAPQAADAEYNIGQSHYAQSNWNEARDAYSRVVTDFASLAQGTTLADAYYKLGMTYERLNQLDAAKQAYQTVVQKYPNTSTAAMANSALQRLNRR